MDDFDDDLGIPDDDLTAGRSPISSTWKASADLGTEIISAAARAKRRARKAAPKAKAPKAPKAPGRARSGCPQSRRPAKPAPVKKAAKKPAPKKAAPRSRQEGRAQEGRAQEGREEVTQGRQEEVASLPFKRLSSNPPPNVVRCAWPQEGHAHVHR